MTLTAMFIVFSLTVMSVTAAALAWRGVASVCDRDEQPLSALSQAVVATMFVLIFLVPFYCLLTFVFRVLPLMGVI